MLCCVAGCEVRPCPAGQVYYNLTSLECVPVSTCKPVCTVIEGTVYYEGDIVAQDECYTWWVSTFIKQYFEGTQVLLLITGIDFNPLSQELNAQLEVI